MRQFERADNMTDAMAALAALANSDCPERAARARRLLRRWKDEPLVVDKWLRGAGDFAPARHAGEGAGACAAHPAFDTRNPNKVYALIRGFCTATTCASTPPTARATPSSPTR